MMMESHAVVGIGVILLCVGVFAWMLWANEEILASDDHAKRILMPIWKWVWGPWPWFSSWRRTAIICILSVGLIMLSKRMLDLLLVWPYVYAPWLIMLSKRMLDLHSARLPDPALSGQLLHAVVQASAPGIIATAVFGTTLLWEWTKARKRKGYDGDTSIWTNLYMFVTAMAIMYIHLAYLFGVDMQFVPPTTQ